MATDGKAAQTHHDAHEIIERAKKFSVKVPVVGTVRVPPPDQLAFYGVLGILAAVNVIDWPVALAVGAGQAIISRHLSDQAGSNGQEALAAKAPAKKAAPSAGHRPAKATHS